MGRKRLLVLGPTGGTGQQVVVQALEAGHEVTAFARSPEKLPVQHERLRRVAGRLPDDAALLADETRGQDAVISALGRGMSLKSEQLIQRSVPPILAGMQAHGVRRLIFTSAIGVGDAVRDVPFIPRLMARVMLKDLYADKVIGEELIRRSGLDWTILQPAHLTNGPLTGRYRAGERLNLRGAPKISRADVAHFIVSHLDDSEYIRKAVVLAY
jgi:putative NADH-flavin reductase